MNLRNRQTLTGQQSAFSFEIRCRQ